MNTINDPMLNLYHTIYQQLLRLTPELDKLNTSDARRNQAYPTPAIGLFVLYRSTNVTFLCLHQYKKQDGNLLCDDDGSLIAELTMHIKIFNHAQLARITLLRQIDKTLTVKNMAFDPIEDYLNNKTIHDVFTRWLEQDYRLNKSFNTDSKNN